ncbi:hypothetical protein GDO81_021623 [Engystomops pustulosus]|uniref:Uncharacterized protein n=1 Tax=Engystomops pustulosus TaxID=76066 RepID=A0AAV6ZPF5_ENGPU|nr:hypothetical protein GDO81_021623 [Engystomops pustulosus]
MCPLHVLLQCISNVQVLQVSWIQRHLPVLGYSESPETPGGGAAPPYIGGSGLCAPCGIGRGISLRRLLFPILSVIVTCSSESANNPITSERKEKIEENE